MSVATPLTSRECGTIEQSSAKCPLFVQDPATAWVVQSGKVDLFLVPAQGGQPVGSRFHILRIEQGQAIFGVAPFSDEIALVATTLPGTTVLRISQREVRGRIAAGDESYLSLLENWICDVGAALSTTNDAGPCVSIETGETVVISDEPKVVIPKRLVAWVTHIRGESRFLARGGEAGINGSVAFPVSRYGWVLADPGSEIRSIHPCSLPLVDPEWRGLQDFHTLAMSCFVENRRSSLELVRKRARSRDAAESRSLQNTILRLASPMSTYAEVSESDDTCQDSVFLACERIGKRLGIRIKPAPEMLRGLPLADPVTAVARASGVRVRRVMLKGEWWKQDNGPLLAFRGEAKRAVAVLSTSSRTVELFDPLEQRASPINREVAASVQPFAYTFYRHFPLEKLNLFDLLRFGLKGCESECATILLTGAAMGLLAVVFPYVTGVAFDRLIPGAENRQLAAICGVLLSLAVGTALLGYSRGCAVLRLEGKMSAAVQAAVWDRLLALPVSFFRNYSSGDLAQRSMGIEQIRQMLTAYSLRALLSGIFSAFSLMLLFYYSVPLALVAAGLLAISYMATLVWTMAQVGEQRELCNLQGRISGKLLQFISGIAKFRVSGTENRAFAVWARLFSRQKQVAMRIRRTSNQLTVFNSVFSVVSLGTLFYFHGLVMSSSSPDRLKTGEFLAFLAAFTQCMVAALTLNSTVVTSAKIVPVYERSKPILEAIPEVTESKAAPGMLVGDVEISQITFRYAQGLAPTLRDVSIRIPHGEFVAVVGPSGSGKSTLFRLLLGFEIPENGAIYYDGQDLNGLDVQAVRRQIGVVLQSSRPIGGTIFENIIGSAPLTVKDAWEAARMAGLEEDIRRMPMGLHTFLAAGGQGISGGQRQRLLIARAIVGRPRILLFDEATSALDNRTQETVSRSLESLQSTRIVIAHRLSTILHANRIFVLDKGAIVQSGCYQELMEQEGLFREFAKRQLA